MNIPDIDFLLDLDSSKRYIHTYINTYFELFAIIGFIVENHSSNAHFLYLMLYTAIIMQCF